MSDDDNGICQNTMATRAMLATNCLGAGAFGDDCAYTQYEPQKTMFCNAEATAWNMLCDGETIGTTAASRDAACLANANADAGHMGSDTRCGLRTNVIAACPESNPFAHVGCNNVADIDVGFRTNYCALSANLFKSVCRNGTHGAVFFNRREACLTFGTGMGGDASCDSNTFAADECAKNPFDDTHPGCQNLLKIEMIVNTYCEDTNPSDPNCGVKTSSWIRSFGEGKAPPATLTATTPATERQREFLLGLATVTNDGEGLDDTGATDATHFSLTLKSAMYSGEPLGGAGDASDGFAAFVDTVATGNYLYYAGLLLNTDLGSPLTETTGSVTWYGQIQIFRAGFEDNNEDFQLKITFGTNPAVSDSVGSIEGIVKTGNPNGNQHYQLKGTYDASGVITGTTTRGAFTGSPLVTAEPVNGILTGLIGAQGAVGAFISGSNIGAVNGSTKDNIIGNADSSTAYAGGFVAAPYIPAEEDDADKVTFRDWLREFDYPLPTSSAVEIARTTSKPHFIRPKTDGTLDLTGVTGTTQHKATRAGDDKDGFAYGVGNIVTSDTPAGISHSFVGILPSTDLGAPLTEAIAIAKWLGQFSFGNSATLNDIEFTLTFDGTNSGTIDGMFGFVRFDLVFDGKGIVTGDVTYSPSGTNPTTTVARGLIGEEGLVGVFTNINDGNTTGIEFGGFVAAPPVANRDVWANSFSGGVPATLTRLALLSRQREFLAGGETALSEADTIGVITTRFGLTFASAMYDSAALIGNNDIKDGFAGFVDPIVSGSNHVYYAGILSGTDLGKPLTQTVGSFTWNGQIEIVRNNTADISTDFSLEITLGAVNGVEGSLGEIEGAVLSNGTNHYQLTGTYNKDGVITGTVIYGEFMGSIDGGDLATSVTANGILSGLIGEQGAVGVFLAGGAPKETIVGASSATDIYAGGFVVSGAPPPRQPVTQPDDTNENQVTFKDWLRDFGDYPPPDRLTKPPRARKREFLAGDTEGLATNFAVNADDTRNISANLASLGRSGDAADGYNYFFDTLSQGVHIPYAGLLSGTDLGARVTGSTGATAVWHGRLKANRLGTIHIDQALELTITYGGTNGEMGSIAGEVQGDGNTLYQLRGDYDDSGVIEGTVYYGQVNQISLPNLVRTFPSAPPNGFLTGLIGEQGAVGVFISGSGTKEDIGSPVGNYYAGGFIVAPPSP